MPTTQYEGKGSSQQEAYTALREQLGEKAKLLGEPVYTVSIDGKYSFTSSSFETAYIGAVKKGSFVVEQFNPTEHTLEVVATAKFKGQGAGAAPSLLRSSDLTDRLF